MIQDVQKELHKYKKQYESLVQLVYNQVENNETTKENVEQDSFVRAVKDVLQDSGVIITDMIQLLSRKQLAEELEFRRLVHCVHMEGEALLNYKHKLELKSDIAWEFVVDLQLSPFHLKSNLQLHLLSDK